MASWTIRYISSYVMIFQMQCIQVVIKAVPAFMRLNKGFPELSPESISYIRLEVYFKTFITNEVFLHITLRSFVIGEDIPCGILTPAKLI